MMFYTHIAFSFLVGLISSRYFGFLHWYFYTLVLIFGVIPDIDYYKSKVRIPFVSFFITLFLKHRGVFHSIFIPVVAYFAFSLVGYNPIGLAILLGYLSHLFLDALTQSGIKLFWPFSFRIRGFIRTNYILEKIFFLTLLILNVYAVFLYY